MAGKSTGSTDEQRHDKTDKRTDDDIDIAEFKANVLPHFDA